MMKKSFKKFMAGMLTASMVLGTMIVPAAAQELDPFWTSHPNLTPYDTNYNFVVAEGKADEFELKVQGIDEDFVESSEKLMPSSTLAEEVTWDFAGDTADPAITFSEHGYYEVSDTEYAASTFVTVGNNATPGVHVIEAKNPKGNTIDFTVQINPADEKTPVGDISVRVYKGAVNKQNMMSYELDKGTVYANKYPTTINYPTAIDALATAAGEGNYDVELNYGSYVVRRIGDITNNDETDEGWQYRVYDSSGTMKSLSEIVGAGTYSLEAGDVVVWAYGTYTQKLFTDTYTVPEASE